MNLQCTLLVIRVLDLLRVTISEPLKEDWDSAPSCGTYDPQAKCLASKVVRGPPRNSTKSQRKQFAEDERLRIQAIRDREEAEQQGTVVI